MVIFHNYVSLPEAIANLPGAPLSASRKAWPTRIIPRLDAGARCPLHLPSTEYMGRKKSKHRRFFPHFLGGSELAWIWNKNLQSWFSMSFRCFFGGNELGWISKKIPTIWGRKGIGYWSSFEPYLYVGKPIPRSYLDSGSPNIHDESWWFVVSTCLTKFRYHSRLIKGPKVSPT